MSQNEIKPDILNVRIKFYWERFIKNSDKGVPGLCFVVSVWYILKKHWLANDLCHQRSWAPLEQRCDWLHPAERALLLWHLLGVWQRSHGHSCKVFRSTHQASLPSGVVLDTSLASYQKWHCQLILGPFGEWTHGQQQLCYARSWRHCDTRHLHCTSAQVKW